MRDPKRKNRFENVVTNIIGTLFSFMSFSVALISYSESGEVDIKTTLVLLGIGIFLLFAEDELINQLLLGLPEYLKKKLGINTNNKDESK